MNKQTTFRFLKVERVAGIEPASLAWKAKVLPLNYTRALTIVISNNSIPRRSDWWWGKDSNLRRHSRQIYSLIPLTAWVPHPIKIKLYSIVARSNLETRQPPFGAATKNRTPDLLITSELLYQLSYGGTFKGSEIL